MTLSSDLKDDLKCSLGRRWAWAGGLGALFGAGAAVLIFPGAGMMKNPTGEFGWHLVGFALLVGLGFALGQWVVLRRLAARYLGATPVVLALWIPASALSVVAMLLPLWWVPGGLLFLVPFLLIPRMLPGILALAVLQWLILRRLTPAGAKWVSATILGAGLGAIAGLYWSVPLILLGVTPSFAPVVGQVVDATFEMGWAFVTGGTIGLFQTSELIRAIGDAIEGAEGD